MLDSIAGAELLEGFLTQERLAETLNTSVRTLRRWHAARKGPPCFRQGKLILYSLPRVRQWLEEGQAPSPVSRKAKPARTLRGR